MAATNLISIIVLVLSLAGWPLDVVAQGTGAAPMDAAAQAEAQRLKRVFGLRPAPPAVLVRESSLAVQAWQLRDYCADPRLDNAFVAAQLEKFSKISGRTEDCASILQY